MNADLADIGFIDIGIVDLDLKKTTWSRVHSAMRTLYLGLSRTPDLAWTRFFHEERESRIVIKRHGLWIEDDFIVFDCLLPDVEAHHLPDFRLSIAYANRKSRELLAKQQQYSEEQHRNTRAEQQRLMELRAHIRGADDVPLQAGSNTATSPQPAPVEVTLAAREHWADEHDLALADAGPALAIETTYGQAHAATDIEVAAPDTFTAPGSEREFAPGAAAPADAAGPARDEFDDKRTEWRARFRAALTTRKESDRGND